MFIEDTSDEEILEREKHRKKVLDSVNQWLNDNYWSWLKIRDKSHAIFLIANLFDLLGFILAKTLIPNMTPHIILIGGIKNVNMG